MDFVQNSVPQASPAQSDDSDVGQLLPPVPDRCGPQTVSLAIMLDFAIQQALHELTILSEMLPMKDQQERKKSIVQFAHATRLMFVKMLAIVKWLRTSKKFEPLASICYFLDVQADYFVDTANRLFDLSRIDLQQARLPLFQVSTAIDVLTTGTYPRLPMAIKDSFVANEKLTEYETCQTILMLNERLVLHLAKALPTLPKRVSMFRVYNGTIIMRVKGEFQARLTIMPSSKVEFLLLSINVLVREYDIGGGMELVHPLQLNTIHEVLQQRISISEQPFLDIYKFMHNFALALKLDILECQARKMHGAIAANYVRVDSYNPQQGFLEIRYWLNDKNTSALRSQSRINKLLSNSVVYRMRIFYDTDDIEGGLYIRHSPPSMVKLINEVPKDRQLSMGRILSAVISMRIKERLLLVRQLLAQVPPNVGISLDGAAAPCLIYELLVHENQSHRDEHLVVSVNAFFGHIVCQVHCLGQHETLRNLERELNGNCQLTEVARCINKLRITLIVNRYSSAVVGSQVKLIAEPQLPHIDTVKNIPRDRIILQFLREPCFYLIVGFRPDFERGMTISFRLVHILVNDKLVSMEIDPFALLAQAPGPTFFEELAVKSENELEIKYENPKNSLGEIFLASIENASVDVVEPRMRSKWSGTENQVKMIIAALDDRLTFLRISQELHKADIAHELVFADPVVGGLSLKITDMRKWGSEEFFEAVAASVRIDSRRGVALPIEFVVSELPLIPNFYQNRAMGKLKIVPANTLIGKMVEYENKRIAVDHRTRIVVHEITAFENIAETVATTVRDRASMCAKLFTPVKRFSRVYNRFENSIDVLFYNYQKLVLAYGPRRSFTVSVQWKTGKPGQFCLQFGQVFHHAVGEDYDVDYEKQVNPHLVVQQYLTEKFNADLDLIDLAYYLVNTTMPLQCLSNLNKLQFRSLKSFAILMGLDSLHFAVDYQIHFYAADAHTIKLVVGPVHLELFLVDNGAVCIREVTPGQPAAIGLMSFIKSFSDAVSESDSEETPETEEEPSQEDTNAMPDEIPNIGSLPAMQQKEPVDVPNPRSVPDEFVLGRQSVVERVTPKQEVEDDFEMAEVEPEEVMEGSREVTYVSCKQLMAMCCDVEDKGVPFDHYLFALTFLPKIGKALENYKNTNTVGHLPLKEVVYEPNDVCITAETMNMGQHREPGTVSLSCYLCPEEFRVKAKINYAGGVQQPQNVELRILTRFFESCVMPLMNEYAVLGFVNLCRISLHNVFVSITHIMEAQMNPNSNFFWLISIHLAQPDLPSSSPSTSQSSASSHPSQQQQPELGVLFNFGENHVQFTISLRPDNCTGKERFLKRRYLEVKFNFQTGAVSVQQIFPRTEEPGLQAIVQAQLERSRGYGECPLWPCIRALLERSVWTSMEMGPMHQ